MWVVVPAHEEEARLADTLRALAAQRDRDFTLLVVDNASADGTGAVARAFAARAPFPVEVIEEPEKGVGSAVDTGFRYAIGRGAALLARTD
ncbi:glycosyltransferase, partial [Streptomyces virginiae]